MGRYQAVVDIGDWRGSIQKAPISAERRDSTDAELQTAFRSRLPLPRDLEPTLYGALRYLLDHSGSMVRPRIVCRMAAVYGLEKDRALDLAIALEYFHTASLVFDDLPAMDNASMRRGVPCVHIAYGESTAMLAALALINRAYGLIWRVASASPLGVRQQSLEYLQQHLGVHGLLNGQGLDLNYSSLEPSLESTERVARGKTVSLISLTLVLPAMLGGASERELQLLERISMHWGLGYQTVDDLKDVLQSSAAIGKTAARDESLGRPNIALAIGVPAAVLRLTRLLKAGDRALAQLLKVENGLVFLKEFRGTLRSELSRVIDGAKAIPAR